MKHNLPGPFTFILNGTNRLPKIFRNRKEVGIRMPDNNIIREIARLLDAPIMTTTLPYEEHEDLEYKMCIRDRNRTGRIGFVTRALRVADLFRESVTVIVA